MEFSELFNSINDGFDIIIGNPPYVSWKDIPPTRRLLLENGKFDDINYNCRPNHSDAHPNYYLFFITRALKLIQKNGIISFILPQEWIFHNYATDFRNYFLKKSKSIHLLYFDPKYRIFRGIKTIGTNSMIMTINILNERIIRSHSINIYDKNKITKIIKELPSVIFDEYFHNKDLEKQEASPSTLINNSWEIKTSLANSLITEINRVDTIGFSNREYFSVFGGFQPLISKVKLFSLHKEDIEKFTKKEQEYIFPVAYNASEIKRYKSLKSEKYWIVLNKEFKSEQDLSEKLPNIYNILESRIKDKEGLWWEFPNVRNLKLYKRSEVKILSPRTSKENSFSIDKSKHIIKGTNTCIISRILSPFFVLGILNSKLANAWYREFGYDYHGTKTKKYEPGKIKEFMISIPKSESNYIVFLVKHLLDITNTNKNDIGKIRFVEYCIDRLVYDMYGLSEDLIASIEKKNLKNLPKIPEVLKFINNIIEKEHLSRKIILDLY